MRGVQVDSTGLGAPFMPIASSSSSTSIRCLPSSEWIMSNSAILTFHGSASPGSPAAPAPRCSPRSSSPFSPISTARAAPASVSKDTSAQFLPLYLVRTLAAMMCPAGAKASHTEISSADECSMPPTQTVRAALPSSCAHAAGSALPSPPSRASKASTVPFPLSVRSGMAADLQRLAGSAQLR